jgi:hypothetical protein
MPAASRSGYPTETRRRPGSVLGRLQGPDRPPLAAWGSRERAKLDDWEWKQPPSTKLRQWFGHEPGRFEEFRRRYIEARTVRRLAIP